MFNDWKFTLPFGYEVAKPNQHLWFQIFRLGQVLFQVNPGMFPLRLDSILISTSFPIRNGCGLGRIVGQVDPVRLRRVQVRLSVW